MPENKHHTQRKGIGRMLTDAVLPPDVQPETEYCLVEPRIVFLTGVCGFLGRHVARELLQHTDLRLVCLVREKQNETAIARVARILSGVGVGREDIETRVEVLVGDVTQLRLGLDADSYTDLVGRIDTIYHCAAQVDWVHGYEHLHSMNVGGVLAMIRFACQGRVKRLVFTSSMAVCYAWNGPEQVDENTDMLAFIGGMPLGYARSKCVAEALLRQAGARGVPVTVLRPALISGDSTTGVSNPKDFIASIIQGCVLAGMAIDTDWRLDCVPVDFVAKVMVQASQGSSNWQMLHLRHEHPRYWRELILWMNLHGYPVELVNDNLWIQRLFEERHARGTILYPLRQFFRGTNLGGENTDRRRPYEAYLAKGQARIDDERTRALLRELGVREASLDADLLHAYFDDYRKIGVLPPQSNCTEPTCTLDELLRGSWFTQGMNGGASRWIAAERTAIGADDGILSEMAAARVKDSVGLRRLHLRDSQAPEPAEPNTAVLKAKVSDELLQELTVKMARVCHPELGRLFGQYRDALGLFRSHERELAFYELNEPRLHDHIPYCYGTLREPGFGRWALLLEYLPEAENSKRRVRLRADSVHMDSVLTGLAEIHAIWYGRDEELATHSWLTAPPDTTRMLEMTPLWRELADFAGPLFRTWCGPDVGRLQAQIIADLAQWWKQLHRLPRTLIHNDFNPRNMVLRKPGGKSRLCVYDWELATLGVPQHDLAEFLCFTWHREMTGKDLDRILGTYRDLLASLSGREIDLDEWRTGFVLALQHLLINRLAMYTLMHRFRPLEYLPRVMGNWMRLYSLA